MRTPGVLGAAFFLVAACAGEPTTPAVVHAAAPPVELPHAPGVPVRVEVSADAPAPTVGQAMEEAATAAGFPCQAVFVWGDLRELGGARPLSVTVRSGDAKLAGFVVCEADMPEFLGAQRDNPRLRGAHGGACDVRWSDGQLFLRRVWAGTAEAPLGDLSADTTTVLQKGELLAAIFDPRGSKDPHARAAALLPVLARVPKFFLFGMWPLSPP